MKPKTLLFNMLGSCGNCYKPQTKDRNESLPLPCQSMFLGLLLLIVTAGLVFLTLVALPPLNSFSQPWAKHFTLHPQSLTKNNHGKAIPPYEVAYPQNYHFVLDQPLSHEAPFLVLMVPVAPGNLESRQVIRRTWGKEGVILGRAVRVFFLLGMPGGAEVERQQEQLKTESLEHQDLLQGDFLDSYFNLTIKTMMMLEWLSSRCPNASYAMKVDSDMFVNVHNLVSLLAAPSTPTRDYITGIIRLNSNVVRDPTSKWYIPRMVFPSPKFPPYFIGNGYVFSLDVAGKVVEASRQVRAIYIEDAYLGMCLNYLGIPLSYPPNSAVFRLYPPYRNKRCFYSSVVMTLMESLNDLQEVWVDLQRFGSAC